MNQAISSGEVVSVSVWGISPVRNAIIFKHLYKIDSLPKHKHIHLLINSLGAYTKTVM